MSSTLSRTGLLTVTGLVAGVALIGCTKHEIEVKPIEVKPIYIQLDIRIQQQVDESLEFVKKARGAETAATAPSNP